MPPAPIAAAAAAVPNVASVLQPTAGRYIGASMTQWLICRTLLAFSSRSYATATPAAAKSKQPLVLLALGITSGAGYLYLDRTAPPPKPKQEKSPLDPQNFIDFKLKKVVPYNHNTARASNPDDLKDAKDKPVIRPYTPVSPPDAPGELTLLIKKYDTGNMSKYIHSLKEGDTLAIKGPIAKFPYQANEFEEVALIGGGSGITPLYQILTHALADKNNTTKFKLIYANVTEKDILLREELDTLKAKFPKTFDVVYLLDKASEGWKGPVGFVTADIIKANVGSPDLKEKVKIFVCGPPPQVASVAGKKAGMKQGEIGGVLKELGYTSDQVFKF
ncbi:cytochrome-b5 reductase [Pholiota molesta]|nr:cytochrome-b5 reductase [Pholiota molesta]